MGITITITFLYSRDTNHRDLVVINLQAVPCFLIAIPAMSDESVEYRFVENLPALH